MNTKRKHQWLYSLSLIQLEELAKKYPNAYRKVLTPAEKRIVTILIKDYTHGPKIPSAAQKRARLLGQCKFFLTGMTGTAQNLLSIVINNTSSDLLPYCRKDIINHLHGVKEAILRANTAVAIHNTHMAPSLSIRKHKKAEENVSNRP